MTHRLYVTDHAIVRYLERVLHLDVDKIREDIRCLATNAAPVTPSGKHTNSTGLLNPTGKAMLVVDETRVVTVLGKREIERAGRWVRPIGEAVQ